MSLSVLVVENNPVIQRAVSAILEQEGCLVQTAENGLDALNKLKEDTPDLLFTDLVMPYVSGEQLCRIVKTNPS
ncbi:response regulator [Desulfosediminicola ganghwensis]|uniref:response regulator n=1 Tax=Desulfosediminicola ganghwensis TaxID=2569540 RepID=UPI0010ABB470|nr:response regulator [Desulfosediminicola ganghwensis]